MDEKARKLLEQLGITGPAVVLPTGEFTGGGFVGQLMAAHLYRVNIEGEEQVIDGVVATNNMGEWGYSYYFKDQDKAKAAAKAAQLKYKTASAVHRIEMETRSVIAKPETLAKLLGQGESKGFGEVITGEVAVRTVTSKKYRHEWQLIAFPCIVSAAARLFSYDVEPFDISELRGQDAVKFTDAGGQVILSTALGDRGEVILRVRDTGIGMTEKELALAMEPFRQVASTRRTNSAGIGGTGLGLPITKALVEANKGTILITSAKNEGTLVEITFPPQRVLAS